MTEHQLHRLESLANGATFEAPQATLEAIRAILAERAELIDGCKMALGYAVKYCNVPDRDSRLKPVVDILIRANGGQP